jgi:OOP family OmpA-OmpF porin
MDARSQETYYKLTKNHGGYGHMKQRIIKNKTLITSAALATFAFAMPTHADPSGLELNIGINQFLFNDDTPLDDSTGFRLGIGYRFESPWGIELAYNKTSADFEGLGLTPMPSETPTDTDLLISQKAFSDITSLDASIDDLDVEHYYLDVLYHFNNGGKIQPYLALGYGIADAELVDGDSVDFGAGIKYYVSENLTIRPDIHFADVSEFDDSHLIASLSLSWIFGGKSAPAPTPAPKAPLDSDNDGVPNSQDNCPTTPAGESVNSVGCPLDSDNDGVIDSIDQCPDTPANTEVDAEGCTALSEPVSIELKVNFDSNSDVVKSEYLDEVKDVADFLKKYTETTAVIEGHTDTSGSAAYNKSLSQRRADAVAKVLVEQFGIASNRVSAIGYGEEQPIADESTREGMLANRRVIAKISTAAE